MGSTLRARLHDLTLAARQLLTAEAGEPRAAWGVLERGDYDWSHMAMHYWPDRVLAKCREIKSYVIAHGVEAPAQIGCAASP